jgi:hypothetical protein
LSLGVDSEAPRGHWQGTPISDVDAHASVVRWSWSSAAPILLGVSNESEFSAESDDRRRYWFASLNAAARDLRPSLKVDEPGFLIVAPLARARHGQPLAGEVAQSRKLAPVPRRPRPHRPGRACTPLAPATAKEPLTMWLTRGTRRGRVAE